MSRSLLLELTCPPHPPANENIYSRSSAERERVIPIGSVIRVKSRENIYQRSLVKCFSTNLFDCGLSNCCARLAFACFILRSSITRLFSFSCSSRSFSFSHKANERFFAFEFSSFRSNFCLLNDHQSACVFCVLLGENDFIWIGCSTVRLRVRWESLGD